MEKEVMGPLAGVRVADFSVRSTPAALATMLLTDLGADVLRIQPPAGDPLGALPGTAVWWSGQRIVSRRDAPPASTFDVLIDTPHARHDPPEWNDRPSRQVRALITAAPWSPVDAAGPTGSTAVYGELAEAHWGLLHLQDGVRPGPVFLGWPHADFGAGWLAAIGIIAALYERERSGLGQVVTTSLVDGLAIHSTSRWIGGDRLDRLDQPRSTIGRVGDERAIISLFQCADEGWIQVHTGPRGAFDRLMALLDLADLVPPAAGAGLFGRPLPTELADRMWDRVTAAFRGRPARDWVDLLSAADICVMPILAPGEALGLAQVRANELATTDDEGIERLHRWALFDRTPIRPAAGSALSPVAVPDASSKATPSHSPPRVTGGSHPADPEHAAHSGPLAGVTVLDLGIFMAGPFTARILADLGARVIKVEEPAGDPMRHPLGAFSGVQRGKESIALDLKSDTGRATMGRLLDTADVLVSNLRQGALARLGLDPATAAARNDRLVYCHTTGYGNRGPWRNLPAFEPLHSAVCGLLDRAGGPDNPPAHYLSHMDFGCGLTAATAIIAALYERERSGVGQHLEVPQLAAGLVAMSDVHRRDGVTYDSFTLDPELRGHAPTNGLYRLADGWIVIACGDDIEWNGLRAALDLAAVDWPAYATARLTGRGAAPADAIQSRLTGLTAAAAGPLLDTHRVPWALPRPVESARVDREPGLTGPGIVVATTHPTAGEIFEVGHTIRFSRTVAYHRRPAPTLDQHRAAILAGLAGTTSDVGLTETSGTVGRAGATGNGRAG
ncbi:CoA transferase [Plantactinospora sp. GCM10030261]|uniref:CaiB/BaiF CoA-transferase family protein n=1 Tax=Plantactinospora sp. GCM10030261 TaxID=3273420 RepID=UPI00362360B0